MFNITVAPTSRTVISARISDWQRYSRRPNDCRDLYQQPVSWPQAHAEADMRVWQG